MDSQYSAISITMPKVKISHLEKSTFIYEIDVATRWGKWHIQKKYTQFQDLHRILEAEFNDLPEFPSSLLNYFISETEDQASEYQQILENYLQETSKRKDIVNTNVYIQFLQLDKHSPLMLAKKPKFLHQFEMEERINDEGKVILDYYYDEEYIVFCTGNDNPIEKFNSLLANTRFPWEEDEELEFVLPLGTVECWLKKKETMQYRRVWARNYPIETRNFIFSPKSSSMVVGLSDGSIEVFKLIQKPRYIYYQLPKMLKVHEDEICALHLDEINMIIYSASIDGWLNIIDANRVVLIDTLELSCNITTFIPDTTNMRIFVSLAEGNIEIYEYSHNAKLKHLHSIATPVEGEMKSLLFDPMKNYLFAASYESGEVFIFQIGKRGHEKLSKQIGFLKNKDKIIDMIWNNQKMELLVNTESGEIFFWNTVKGQQIYMLKAFDDIKMSKSLYLKEKHMIITASRGRRVKFWEIPSSWRDVMAEVEQEREIQIRRKVENLYKVREAIKKKEENSDEDDLKGWHWRESDSDDNNEV